MQLHLQPFLPEQAGDLQMKLEAAQTENRQLADEIVTQRVEIDALLSSLESVIGDLEGANRVLQGEETEGVAELLNYQR